jgi:isopenicillin N synthase-like dioxygenase
MEPMEILAALQHRGYFILPLSEEMFDTQEEMFRQFDIFDSRSVTEKTRFSLTPDAIGENNGWHGAGGLSRYNQCREGIIFQASCVIWPMLSDSLAVPAKDIDSIDDFSIAHENFRNEAHLLAGSIMEQVACALELPEPAAYFTKKGPLDIIAGSQFHVKKVILSEAEDLSALHKNPDDDRYLTLRAHRDPSVVSIVFHKCRSADLEHGLGLQFKDPDAGCFVNIPVDADEVAGRSVCVVIAGSILELLSDGK